ncbi:GIY-YIG nuclease family protein [Scytonema sp. UIC 10036]|nr:GIY-YIG nuclease family protein [Scytonema sp. UIC 10036]
MDKDALLRWKQRIFDHQQQVRETKPVQQVALFDLTPSYCDPDKIDPLTLRLQPMSFYRMATDGTPGSAAIYFIVDNTMPLILYIGETCRSNKRWKGVHDCKDYIANYLELHYRYGLQTAVGIKFWWDAPLQRKPRQQLEQVLIQKWRSPFNKEMWKEYGQPFG